MEDTRKADIHTERKDIEYPETQRSWLSRDRSRDSHKQGSQKKKESKGTEERDSDNFKQIKKMLDKALQNLKSEENTSKKEKDPPSMQ